VKRRRWVTPVVGAFALVVGIMIGSAGGGSSDTPSASAPDVTTTDEYRALAAERDDLAAQVEDLTAGEQPAAEAPAEEPADAPAALTNGDYIMGTNIEPGRYTMTVADGAIPIGYVDQTNGDEYLAQESAVDAGTAIVVDLVDVPGSIVEFSGVEGITKVG
jgi:hypothetical protein